MDRRTIAMIGVSAVLLWAGVALAEGDGAELGMNASTDDVNLGAGTQTNIEDWEAMESVNINGNQLTGGGTNSNGGDRDSDDVVLLMGDDAEVANYALDASVTDNKLMVGGNGSHADSEAGFDANSGFDNSFGVTAVSVNAGASASQSVNVNVTSSVSM